ncbi:hypothetical protein OAF44_01680 [Akkermansiaceae bacterium]|nr:hypothetical protein [Akkermansiaceae bacterium]
MALGSALIPVARASDLEAQAQRASDEKQNTPMIQGLASHVHKRWEVMRDHHQDNLEERLAQCVRARNMEYEPAKLAEIQEQGGSEIFMGIVSAKCRTATAWLRDTLLGTGTDKPWSLTATPIPEVPPDITQAMQNIMQQNLMQYYDAGGEPPDEAELKQLASGMKDTAMRAMKFEAEKRVERMETKMEDQMLEGGFTKALFEFTNDIATFPYAILKGPIPRKRKAMKYVEGGLGVVDVLRDEWERVDPFKFYWMPWGDDIHSMPVAELHHLTRDDVENMLGVEGYDEDAVRSILSDFGSGGFSWLDHNDDLMEDATGQDFDEANTDLVAAIQLWDTIPGDVLLEWGLSEDEVEDPHKSYPCEVWMIDNIVVRAVLNYDPLGRKPYYMTSFEKVPGRIDGNGVADLCMDAQNMCNAAARALANNMGISSGPQVGVNISRLPNGEDITQMYPWKIWQFKQSDYQDSTPPMTFFQPNSNAAELMGVFDRFMAISDEVSGIPRYMTGQHVPGAGRTSSGLSMLMSNAGKSIKQVISNIDHDVMRPMLERQYQRNLRYSDDPDLIGDVQIVATGAMSLVVKEAEAVRKTDFLRLILESPVAQQIVGLPGTAELLRDLAGNLNTNVDRLVPSREDVQKQQELAQQQAMMMQEMQAQQQAAQLQEDGTPKGGRQDNTMSPRPNGQ